MAKLTTRISSASIDYGEAGPDYRLHRQWSSLMARTSWTSSVPRGMTQEMRSPAAQICDALQFAHGTTASSIAISAEQHLLTRDGHIKIAGLRPGKHYDGEK